MSRNNKNGYVQKTTLSEDFRRLIPTADLRPAYKSAMRHCYLCLETEVGLRALPCRHTFCTACLQTSIDSAPPDTDSDRGFLCQMCGYFVKVKDPTIPRTEWAAQMVSARHQHVSDAVKPATDSNTPIRKWHMEWKISAYPMSFFIDNRLDPSIRMKEGFVIPKGEIEDSSDENEDMVLSNSGDTVSDKGVAPDDQRLDIDVSDVSAKPASAKTLPLPKSSRITSTTFYNDRIIIYDQGLNEIILYNDDLTVHSHIPQKDIHSIAVLDDILFMTNPRERCIETINLLKMAQRDAIYITKKCYSLSPFDDNKLAVLLSDRDDKDFHVSFLDARGIAGGCIPLEGGHIELKCPSHIAICPLTRLLYVSDKGLGLVKCFLLDGQLIWEKVVYDAGYLGTFNGYLLISREFTDSLDVLSGKGVHDGKLESSEYRLVSPSVISVHTETARILVVDETQMLHIFVIERLDVVTQGAKKTFCTCAIS